MIADFMTDARPTTCLNNPYVFFTFVLFTFLPGKRAVLRYNLLVYILEASGPGRETSHDQGMKK